MVPNVSVPKLPVRQCRPPNPRGTPRAHEKIIDMRSLNSAHNGFEVLPHETERQRAPCA